MKNRCKTKRSKEVLRKWGREKVTCDMKAGRDKGEDGHGRRKKKRIDKNQPS